MKNIYFVIMCIAMSMLISCNNANYEEEIGKLSSQAASEYEKTDKYDDVAVDNLNKKFQELETKINQKFNVQVKTINFKTLPKLPTIDFDGYKIGSQFENKGYKGQKFKKTVVVDNIISYSAQIDIFDSFDIFTEENIITGIMKNYQGRLIDLGNNISTKYRIKFDMTKFGKYPVSYYYSEDNYFIEINMDKKLMAFDYDNGGFMGIINLVICEKNLQNRITSAVNREKTKLFNM